MVVDNVDNQEQLRHQGQPEGCALGQLARFDRAAESADDAGEQVAGEIGHQHQGADYDDG